MASKLSTVLNRFQCTKGKGTDGNFRPHKGLKSYRRFIGSPKTWNRLSGSGRTDPFRGSEGTVTPIPAGRYFGWFLPGFREKKEGRATDEKRPRTDSRPAGRTTDSLVSQELWSREDLSKDFKSRSSYPVPGPPVDLGRDRRPRRRDEPLRP